MEHGRNAFAVSRVAEVVLRLVQPDNRARPDPVEVGESGLGAGGIEGVPQRPSLAGERLDGLPARPGLAGGRRADQDRHPAVAFGGVAYGVVEFPVVGSADVARHDADLPPVQPALLDSAGAGRVDLQVVRVPLSDRLPEVPPTTGAVAALDGIGVDVHDPALNHVPVNDTAADLIADTGFTSLPGRTARAGRGGTGIVGSPCWTRRLQLPVGQFPPVLRPTPGLVRLAAVLLARH